MRAEDERVISPCVQLSPDAGDLWAEVDLGALAANVREVRRLLNKDTRMAVVVKGDGYGHGAVGVAKEALGAGATDVVVSTVVEGVELRLGGVSAPILVMGAVSPGQADLIVDHALIPIVFTEETAESLSGAARTARSRIRVHLKIDTGLGRYGVPPGDAAGFMKRVSHLRRLQWEGVCTHLAQAFVTNSRITRLQVQRFFSALDDLDEAGFRFRYRHIANSAALVTEPDLQLDMVRIGNLVYGMHAGRESEKLDVRPAFRLFARVTAVRDLRPGQAAGYGAEFVARRPMRVAVVPAGYSDGWGVEPRTVSYRRRNLLEELFRRLVRVVGMDRPLRAPNGTVQIGEQLCPILGRLAMGQALVDVSTVPSVKPGDVAYLHSRPPLINRRVPRLYVKDGEAVGLRTVFGYAGRHERSGLESVLTSWDDGKGET